MALAYTPLVRRAAKWFDENYPGWARKVKLRKFEIDSPGQYDYDKDWNPILACGCVTVHLGIGPLERAQMPDFVKNATLWGDLLENNSAVDRLQELWEAEIRSRRARRAAA